MKIKALILFYNQLATLLGSGIDITKALSLIENQTHNRRLKEVIKGIREDISRGDTLSISMSRHTDTFENLHINIVKAGEVSGHLAENMKIIASFLESVDKTWIKLINGFIYPVLLFHAAVFLPSISILITKGILPYLRATLGVLIPIYLAIMAAWWIWKNVSRVYAVKKTMDSIVLGIPYIGNLLKKFIISRFARTLQCTISAGVSIIPALRISAEGSGNLIVRDSIFSIISEIEKGRGLTESLAMTGFFPPLALDMMSTGEESGRMDLMLNKLCEYYEAEGNVALDRMLIILPVVIYFIVALYIAYIVISFWVGYYNRIFQLMQ